MRKWMVGALVVTALPGLQGCATLARAPALISMATSVFEPAAMLTVSQPAQVGLYLKDSTRRWVSHMSAARVHHRYRIEGGETCRSEMLPSSIGFAYFLRFTGSRFRRPDDAAVVRGAVGGKRLSPNRQGSPRPPFPRLEN